MGGAARRASVAAFAALVPAAAEAHVFATDVSQVEAFVDGLTVFLATPDLILPLLALAVVLGLWRAGGLLRAWPHFLVASHLGLAAVAFVGPSVVLMPLGIGLVLAVLAALVPLERVGPALPWLAALLGLTLVAAAFEGHPFTQIPLFAAAGVIITANLVLALIAGLVGATRRHIRHPVVVILWRIVSSWLAAIQVLYLAFLLAG